MKIIILGAGGQAKETIDLIEENINGQILGFINKRISSPVFRYKCLGTDSNLINVIKKHKATHFVIAIGDIKIRSALYQIVKERLKPLTIVSKNSQVSKYAKIGEHCIIYPGSVINAEVRIGDDVLINSNTSIGHESIIGNHVNINPGANIAGRVTINDRCIIGIGASIREDLVIAQGSIIGGGSMVVKNTQPNQTFIGVPAKTLLKS